MGHAPTTRLEPMQPPYGTCPVCGSADWPAEYRVRSIARPDLSLTCCALVACIHATERAVRALLKENKP